MSDEAEASAVAERESHSTEQCSAEAQKCTGRIAEPPNFYLAQSFLKAQGRWSQVTFST